MMAGNSALAIAPASATKWTVISGSMAGTMRLMNAPVFVVGRSPDCEFVLVNDPKVSRKHAQIESNGFGCDVISLNDKNLVLVNGSAVLRAPLADGDVLTFGDTKVQYNLTSSAGPLALSQDDVAVVLDEPPRSPTTWNPAPAAPPAMTYTQRPRPRGKPKVSTSNNKRFLYYGIGALVIWWVLSPGKAKKAAQQIRTEQQIQADVEYANKLKEASETQALKKLDQTVTSRQAQENYVRGFRDYKKGQYERALTSFQACLALNPEHVLCNRYIRLAQRKFDEVVQYQIVLGRKYRDQNQFKACRSAYRNVMVMVKDASSPIYQEAKANYEACDSLVEGRF